MTVRKRSILPRLLIFIVLLVCAAWIWQNYFAYDENGRPPDRYRGDIPTITGTSDADGDGIPDQQDILQGALDYVATRPRYKSAYFVGGWPTDGTGVCTDVVAYGMRAAGLDLPTLVDNDKRAAPEIYFGVPPDKNIDYRRVPNLAVYFSRPPRIRAPLSSGRAATSSFLTTTTSASSAIGVMPAACPISSITPIQCSAITRKTRLPATATSPDTIASAPGSEFCAGAQQSGGNFV